MTLETPWATGKRVWHWFTTCLAIVGLGTGATAQCWKETARFAPGGVPSFGLELSISGDTAVMGVISDATNGSAAGAAYVYRDDGSGNWVQVAFLLPSDGGPGQWFGCAVSIHGDTLVVGAERALDGSNGITGAAYVFERDLGGPEAWGEVVKLVHTGAQNNEWFGNDVAIWGDSLVVGAYRDVTVAGDDAGSATVFDRNLGGPDNWGARKKLVASNAGVDDEFGTAVAISGDHILIGAPHADTAYVFERALGGNNQWGERAILPLPAEASPFADFGHAVAVAGDTAVVGTKNGGGQYAGTFIYERDLGGADAWGMAAAFGAVAASAVATSGDTVVSAWHNLATAADVYVRDQGGSGAWQIVDHVQANPVSSFPGPDGYLALSGQRLAMGFTGGEVRVFDVAGGSECSVGWGEETLAPGAATPGDAVGSAVSLSGGTAVVGAPGSAGGNPDGAAYVFERGAGGAWIPGATLLPSSGNALDLFGSSVSVDGDAIVVGAPEDDENGQNAGAAYVFERDLGGPGNWGEVRKLAPFGPQAQERFGTSVAVSGDSLAIGAPWGTSIAPNGSVHVFERDEGGVGTWGLSLRIWPSEPAPNDNFGARVALDGDDLAVSAWLYNSHKAPGDVYLFERDLGGSGLWGERLRIETPLSLSPSWALGADLSLSEDTLAVGADRVFASAGPGRAYVFERHLGGESTWGLAAELQASDGVPDDDFGVAVAVDGDRLLVGKDNGAESAYLFERDFGGTGAWGERGKLANKGGLDYGRDVALDCDAAIVGATAVGGIGAAFVYVTDTTVTNYCSAGFSASGCQALLSASGLASVSSPSGFTLHANTVEAGKSGFFYYGFNGGQANPWGNGTSLQCVVPPTKRTPLMPGVGTPGTCEGTFAMDLNAYWQSAPSSKLPPANQQVHLQFWYRDPQSTSNLTRSLSDGLIFTVCP